MKYGIGDEIIVFAPASVANVGPCYDIMGYCLDYIGDFVKIKINNNIGQLTWNKIEGPNSSLLENVPIEDNAAYAVADAIWERYWNKDKHPFGVELSLFKYLPISSGLGSSAASGVAAGKGIFEILGLKLSKRVISNYLMIAEEVTAGNPFPDNVVPSYFGGFFLMGREYINRTEINSDLFSVIVKPKMEIPTFKAREAVRNYIINKYLNNPDPESASVNIIELIKGQSVLACQILLAAQNGGAKMLGEALHKNNLLEGARGKLIPHFREVKQTAIDSGAYGCSISGAGPSLVAITSDIETGRKVKNAMIKAFRKVECNWLISPVNNKGAIIINNSIESEIDKGIKFHDFFKV